MMIIKIAEYSVRAAALPQVLQTVERFVRAVRENEPQTFYEAFRRAETLHFVHLMRFHDAAAEKNHAAAPYTKRLVEELYPNCEKPPEFTNLTIIE